MFKLFKQILGYSAQSSSNNAGYRSTLNNAIDNRDNAISMIVQKLHAATGSSAGNLGSMTVLIVNSSHDPIETSWVDDKFISQLRLTLDNNLLQSVGSRQLESKIIILDQLDQFNATEVFPDKIYLTWGKTSIPATKTSGIAEVSIWQYKGSLYQEVYILNSDYNSLWHIGRGLTSIRNNIPRENHIAIRDDDEQFMELNRHVSSSQADIQYIHGKGFFINACSGGCRSTGGVATKIIRGSLTTELKDTSTKFPLMDGDIIELGKSVNLLFKIQD